MYITAGRGGDVYHVTNLNDTGAGSLRSGLSSGLGPRTIVFDVSGTIELLSTLRCIRGDVTIAGQTAPGMGINLKNYGMQIGSHNVVLRHIRVRPGDAVKGPNPGFNSDSLEIKASRVVVDHVSTSWGIDENLSCAGLNFYDVTVQYCTISEGLDQTGLYHGTWDANYDPGGPNGHSMGSLIKPIGGNGVASYHHNLWSQNGNRNPCVGNYDVINTLVADFRNNVIYNNRSNGYSSEVSLRIDMNYIGNYIIAGTQTSTSWRYRAFEANPDNHMYIYQSGNKVDGDRDLVRDGTDTGWSMFYDTYTKLTEPAVVRPVTTHTADQAYSLVLAGAGAFPWNPDSVDQRLIDNITNMNGTIIDSQSEVDGYPTIPSGSRPGGWDGDADGLPTFWETWYGTNPGASDQNGIGAHGYTHLERYLEWLLSPLDICHIGDANADGAVNVGDLGILAGSWEQTGRTYSQGDFNGDGVVNIGDLGILAGQWGWSGPLQPTMPAPEPASLVLLAAGAMGRLRRRRGG